jgi:drug/metabolite transporter (DMT)-like permease
MTDGRKSRIDYLVIFLVMAAYGSYGVFVRWTGLAGKEELVVFWRTLIGMSVFILAILITRNVKQLIVRDCRLLLLASGVVWTLQSFASIKAINLMPISNAAFVIYLAPVLVAILAPIFLKEKLERQTIIALAIAVVGLALIAFSRRGDGHKAFSIAGFGWAVLAAFCYAFLVIMIKVLREKLPTLTICFYQGLVVLILMLPFVRFRVPVISGGGWAALVTVGLFHGGLLGFLYVLAARRVKAQHLGVIAYIDPVSATFFAFVFLQEKPAWISIVGGILIVIAGLIVLLGSTSTAEGPVMSEAEPPGI